MAGLKSLKKIQLGQETTAGSEVNATTVWRGPGGIRDDLNLVFVDEDIGVFAGSDRTYISAYGGTLIMDSTPASFQQLPYILTAGIDADLSGSADSTGSGYVYTYTIPTTAAPTGVTTFTIEGGDNQQEEQMLYCFVSDFTLEGSGGEALMLSANWMGRQVNTGSFTTGVSIPDVETILFSKGKLYIDASGGTAGSTQVTSTLLAATLNYNTGIIPKRTADGSLDFTFIQYTMPEITLDVTFEHNASAVTAKANWRAEGVKLLRLEFQGSTLTTAGNYTYHTLLIDLVGKWESFDELGDQDGNSIVTGTFRNKYSATDATAGQFIVVNELSALT